MKCKTNTSCPPPASDPLASENTPPRSYYEAAVILNGYSLRADGARLISPSHCPVAMISYHSFARLNACGLTAVGCFHIRSWAFKEREHRNSEKQLANVNATRGGITRERDRESSENGGNTRPFNNHPCASPPRLHENGRAYQLNTV